MPWELGSISAVFCRGCVPAYTSAAIVSATKTGINVSRYSSPRQKRSHGVPSSMRSPRKRVRVSGSHRRIFPANRITRRSGRSRSHHVRFTGWTSRSIHVGFMIGRCIDILLALELLVGLNVRYEFSMRPILTCFTLRVWLPDVGKVCPGMMAMGKIAVVNHQGAARGNRSHDASVGEPERQVKDGQG